MDIPDCGNRLLTALAGRLFHYTTRAMFCQIMLDFQSALLISERCAVAIARAAAAIAFGVAVAVTGSAAACAAPVAIARAAATCVAVVAVGCSTASAGAILIGYRSVPQHFVAILRSCTVVFGIVIAIAVCGGSIMNHSAVGVYRIVFVSRCIFGTVFVAILRFVNPIVLTVEIGSTITIQVGSTICIIPIKRRR